MDVQSSSQSGSSDAKDSGLGYKPLILSSDTPIEPAQDENLSEIERQYAAQPPSLPRRIHILGTGSIGKLVAHSLRSIPDPPPITLILHRTLLLKAWQKSKRAITVQDGEYITEQRGFEVELQPEVKTQHGVQISGAAKDVYELADELKMRPDEVAAAVRKEQKRTGQAAQPEKSDESEGKEPAPEDQEHQEDDRQTASDSGYRPLQSGESDGADAEEPSGSRDIWAKYRSDEPIHNLIIATKTIRTITALKAIKHRLSRQSTICFLQNGMGVIDDVNEKIFPDEATRPNYVQGIISHGANVPPEKAEQDPFYVVHAGHGTIALGAIPRTPMHSNSNRPPTPTGFGTDNDGKATAKHASEWSPSTRYMLRTLTRCPVLCAVGFTPIELLQLQLEKLAVNSILNPLTSLIDNRNGTILYNFNLSRTMRMMLAETSLIIRSLPELRGIPNVPNRFSAERLETLVVSVANQTRDNISSMLADVRAGKLTEIEYINGYIVKRGEEMGIKAVVNYAIMQTVMGKARMVQREMADDVPVAGKTGGLNRD